MDETRYHTIAEATLEHCFTQLESAYEAGNIEDLELEEGILTIITDSGRTFVLSKHAPTQQIWLASPLSGGLHFRYDDAAQGWSLPDGRDLYTHVRSELKREGVEVML